MQTSDSIVSSWKLLAVSSILGVDISSKLVLELPYSIYLFILQHPLTSNMRSCAVSARKKLDSSMHEREIVRKIKANGVSVK